MEGCLHMDKRKFLIRDIWVAAYLVTYGFANPELEPVPNREGIWEFVFEDSLELRQSYSDFRHGNDLVAAGAYRDALRGLKKAIAEKG